MNPQQAYAVARTHRQDLLRAAGSARLAAELPPSPRLPRVHFALPSIELGRVVAALRARLAQT